MVVRITSLTIRFFGVLDSCPASIHVPSTFCYYIFIYENIKFNLAGISIFEEIIQASGTTRFFTYLINCSNVICCIYFGFLLNCKCFFSRWCFLILLLRINLKFRAIWHSIISDQRKSICDAFAFFCFLQMSQKLIKKSNAKLNDDLSRDDCETSVFQVSLCMCRKT